MAKNETVIIVCISQITHQSMELLMFGYLFRKAMTPLSSLCFV